MEIEIQPQRGVDPISKRERYLGQYVIRIDGQLAGYIGDHQGARPMLLNRWAPVELEEIQTAVCKALENSQQVGEIAQIGKQPPQPKTQPAKVRSAFQ